MDRLKLMIIVGTRPEIIRLSEVIKKCRRYFDTLLVHTGQNYDYQLNEVKVAFGLVQNTQKFNSLSSKDGNFETRGNKLIMSSDEIADAVHNYISTHLS